MAIAPRVADEHGPIKRGRGAGADEVLGVLGRRAGSACAIVPT